MNQSELLNSSTNETQTGPDTSLDADLATVIEHVQVGRSSVEADLAMERIIVDLNRVVNSQASKFSQSYRIAKSDLRQSAVEGIYDAMSKADEDVTTSSFRLFAKLRIIDRMFLLSAEIGGAVSLTEGALKKKMKVRKINQMVEAGVELPEALDVECISELIYDRYNSVIPLHSGTPIDFLSLRTESNIKGPAVPEQSSRLQSDPAELLEDAETMQLLHEAVGNLDERQRLVIIKRYNLDGEGKRTFKDIGDMLGVNESRACQIAKLAEKALARKLRHINSKAEGTE